MAISDSSAIEVGARGPEGIACAVIASAGCNTPQSAGYLEKAMQIRVVWQGQAAFLGTAGEGHQVLMDGPAEGGGEGRGPRPMEMLLLGLGACSSYDVVSILRKSRQGIEHCEVSVHAVRAKTEPKVFTTIHLHFQLRGSPLGDPQVQRAIRLSAEKYCSASMMLGCTARVTHDYEILAC